MKTHTLVILLIVLALSCTTLKVVTIAQNQTIPERHVPTAGPPVIPDCDAPLWDRIKDRCNGEGQ